MSDSSFIPRRLIQYVKDASILSTSGVREAYAAGRIAVPAPTGLPSLNALVYAEDEVFLDGQRLSPNGAHAYALLHKPAATLSVPRDPLKKGDLGPWLQQMPPGIFAVGRLDRDTTGALLFTTDGDLANRLLRPEHHADKVYQLGLGCSLAPEDPRLTALRDGIDVGPYFAKAKRVVWVSSGDRCAELRLTLDEGRHRQIRRMCRTVKLPLKRLHRLSVGPVAVAGVDLGQWRHLESAEVQALWSAVGGPAGVRAEKLKALHARCVRVQEEGQPDLRLQVWLQNYG